jgi:hypothetical protein
MYRWIPKWGELVGISSEEILANLAHAWADTAPDDAVYRDAQGTWKTITDLSEPALTALGASPQLGMGRHPRALAGEATTTIFTYLVDS